MHLLEPVTGLAEKAALKGNGLRSPGRRSTAALLSLLLWCFPAFGQSLREARFVAQARRGFDDIYNLDYDHAEQVFRALRKEYPSHPAPPLYLGAIIWLREMFKRQDLDLDRFLSPSFFVKETTQAVPADRREAFMDNMKACQSLAQARLSKNPRDLDALYFLAASEGILASFSITLDHSFSKAFSYGNKAYDYDLKVIKLDPNYSDAYLTVGLYRYVVGSLPWYFRWIAAVAGYRGSKEEGIKGVGIAAARGEYTRVDANVVQMVLELREGRATEALDAARKLRNAYPRNYIFQINIAQILEILNQSDQAANEYRDIVRRAAAGEPNYALLPLSTFRYKLGYKFLRMGKLTYAQEQLQLSIESQATPPPERTLSHLRLGQVLDLTGDRSEAVKHYQAVLGLQDVDDSHELARRFLEKPYRG